MLHVIGCRAKLYFEIMVLRRTYAAGCKYNDKK